MSFSRGFDCVPVPETGLSRLGHPLVSSALGIAAHAAHTCVFASTLYYLARAVRSRATCFLSVDSDRRESVCRLPNPPSFLRDCTTASQHGRRREGENIGRVAAGAERQRAHSSHGQARGRQGSTTKGVHSPCLLRHVRFALDAYCPWPQSNVLLTWACAASGSL
jgi:hypothetical protein